MKICEAGRKFCSSKASIIIIRDVFGFYLRPGIISKAERPN
jgi:hypothetical protein